MKAPRRTRAAALSVAKALAKVAATGLTPLDYMLLVMRDESVEPAKRLDAAKAAAPYVHPRLASVAVGNQDDKPFAQVIRWPLSWTAYALATAYHETAHTMQPVVERGGAAYFRRMYDLEGLRPAVAARLGNCEAGDGARFCGRGYVQLTGRTNYVRAGLAEEPDLALRPVIAADVLERGMREGWFTGRRLMDVLPLGGRATRLQFRAARTVVNGRDCAELIADYAVRFQDALLAGGCA